MTAQQIYVYSQQHSAVDQWIAVLLDEAGQPVSVMSIPRFQTLDKKACYFAGAVTQQEIAMLLNEAKSNGTATLVK